MDACRFASGDFAVGLGIGYARLNFVQNLLFGEAGILQARDLRSAQRGMPLKTALQNKLHEVIRQTDEAEGYGVAADGVELIGPGNFKNLRFGIACAGEIGGRVAAAERVFSLMGGSNKSHARIITQPRLLNLYELSDLEIRGIQRFELLQTARPHARFVERTVIRQQMLVAADHEKDTDTEKQSARLHASMLARGKANGLACAGAGPCAKGQVNAALEKRRRAKF